MNNLPSTRGQLR